MRSRSMGVLALALVLSTALCGCSIVGLGYRSAPKHKTGQHEAERLSRLAQLYERQGHPAGAMRLYRQALQADPRSREARERLMALSSQHARPQQPPARTTPAAPSDQPTLLASNQPTSSGLVTSRTEPIPTASLTGSGAPALAPEPPTAAVRAAAPPRTTESVPPAPQTMGPASDSVIVDSASAVASAAAPILALMSQPTGQPAFGVDRSRAETVAAAPAPAPPESPPIGEAAIPAPNAQHSPPSVIVRDVPDVAESQPPAAEPPAGQRPLKSPRSRSVVRSNAPAQRTGPSAVTPEPAAEAIVKLTLPPPRSAPKPTTDGSDWSSSRTPAALPATVQAPAPLSVCAPAPAPATEVTGIAICPQPTADEIAGRATLNPSTWTATDLVRLCPGASEDLLAIVRRLESPDATVRKDALIELAQRADAALPVLGAVGSLFHDTDPQVKAHAAWAACRMVGVTEDCVEVLAGVARGGDEAGATFAAYCLGLLEADALDAIPALQAACRSENTAIRLCAAEALLKITPTAPEPLATLIEGLRDPVAEHRWLAALSLSAASSAYEESAVLALIPALHDPVADVCSSAALALGAHGRAAAVAVPELQAAGLHPDPDVREAVSVALNCIVD